MNQYRNIMNNELLDIIKLYLQKNLKESIDHNKDDKNNFDDVRIARMKASGMSLKDIKIKHPKLFEDEGELISTQSELSLQKINEKEYPSQYKATGSRKKHLDKATSALKDDDPTNDTAAWKSREEEEKKYMTESLFRELINEIYLELLDEKKRKKRKSKKKKAAGKLSAKTKETLKKKAKKRGFTAGSVYREYRKGLAAWGTSGSRKGMSQHQWAHARVNSATPSKPWAVVKKSKAKKA